MSNIFQAFGRISDCRFNLVKSEAFHIGSNISRNDHHMAHLGITWPQYTVNYLGAAFPIKPSKDKFEIFRFNLNGYCNKLAPKLNFWRARGLTLPGKITILKSLILPKLYYKLSMLPTKIYPPSIKRLNSFIYGFIWGSK